MTTQNIFDLLDTWNDGATTFTAVKMNVTDTASAAASLLMDLQIGASSRFSIGKTGSLKLGVSPTGTNQAGTNLTISGSQGTGTGVGGSITFQIATAGSSGALQNTLVNAWSISGAGHFLAGTDNTYDIGASGATRPRNLYVANDTYLNGTLYLQGGGGSTHPIRVGGTGATTLILTNSAANNFGLLVFGVVSASFPALKRSSTTLQVILANDTGFASVQGKLTTDTAYAAGTVVPTGVLTLYDSTGTAYRVPCLV